jgi:hypothetical protein
MSNSSTRCAPASVKRRYLFIVSALLPACFKGLPGEGRKAGPPLPPVLQQLLSQSTRPSAAVWLFCLLARLPGSACSTFAAAACCLLGAGEEASVRGAT